MPFRPPVQFGKQTLTTGIVALTVLLWACGSTTHGLAARTAHPASHLIAVSGSAWAQGVAVSLHDVLLVAPPARYDEWRVHPLGDSVVRCLTAGDRVRRPGAAGWRIEAIGRGTTAVTFVPFVLSGETASAPNEPRFILRVTVR